MHSIEEMLVEKNYSKCPLKKRPVNYQFDDAKQKYGAGSEHLDKKLHEQSTDATKADVTKMIAEEPENLSLKKCDSSNDSDKDCTSSNTSLTSPPPTQDELINVSDCCEDEGVDVDHMDEDDIDEEDEIIDCVDVEEEDEQGPAGAVHTTTQAAALAAAAAVAAASAAAVVVPTPTYPKYGLQPWHMSPYTAEFYRTINNPHLAQQISPLRGDLLSPNSPSDSIGSLSPPPHYLHGRASSVSPPMHTDIIHRPIGVRQLPQSPQHHHRFLPYSLPAYHPHHQHTPISAYPLAAAYPHHHHQQQHQHQHHHQAPISPAYSESSYYSLRSMTPESSCSSLPEDLSLKQKSGHHLAKIANAEARDAIVSSSQRATSAATSVTAATAATTLTSSSASATSSTATPPTTPTTTKKDKNTPPRYQCPDCQKSYSTFSGLTKHQQFHCPAAEGNQVKKSFSCKDCDKTYVSLGALKMHIRTHTLPCKCNICGKAFSRPWLLQGHIRTHTGEKPFSCQHCHRAFADRSNLRAHLQTHSDIKKYSCTSCSKTFSRMSLLTKHSEGGCPGGGGNVTNGANSPAHSKANNNELLSASSGSLYPIYATASEH